MGLSEPSTTLTKYGRAISGVFAKSSVDLIKRDFSIPISFMKSSTWNHATKTCINLAKKSLKNYSYGRNLFDSRLPHMACW